MSYLIRFEDSAALDPEVVGYKYYSLARAARKGHPVPPAFAITTRAHQQFLQHRRWPQGLLSEVLAAADELELENGISIRSSATREDLENQSFAGQYRTFLEVVNRADLQRNIERCWKSADSETVQSYLQAAASGLRTDGAPLMAVVLQKMIHPDTAGVAFGKNPMRPDRDEMVIEAVAGLADNLVSGYTSPYRAVLAADGRLSVTPPGQTSPGSETDPSLLQRRQWLQIGDLLRRLEKELGGGPLDIEWAIDGEGRIWLLQSRAITSVASTDTKIPPGEWTRKIADDLWADRLTPFLAHLMIGNSPRFDMSRYAKWVGIPIKRPTLAIIDGYLYVNCDNLKTMLALIPPRFRSADVTALLPNGAERLPEAPALRTLGIFARCLLLGALVPAANPLLCLTISARRQRRLQQQIIRIGRMPDDHLEGARQKVLAASECLAQIQENNQWPYAFAATLMWMTRWWLVDRAGRSNAEFFKYLHQGADNVALRIERRIRQMARQLAADEGALASESGDPPLDRMSPELRRQFKRFLDRYGCRASQRTLYLKRWAEDPRQVWQLIWTLSRDQVSPTAPADALSTDGNPPSEKGAAATEPPLRNSGRHQPSPPGGVAAGLLKMTRSYLDRREDLRFLLDQCLYVLRQALLALGKETGLEERILFLTPPEIKQLADGRLDTDEARSKAEQRRRRFLRPLPASTFYVHGRPREVEYDGDSALAGIGTSPGRSSGIARIVEDPASRRIRKGDILVARATDPGWTPILGHVGGVVVEEGGLLNHCSIVARELGIPAVVGLPDATRRIAEGSRIIIDGDMGVVYLDSAETESP